MKIDHRITLSSMYFNEQNFYTGFNIACIKNNVKIIEILTNMYPYIIE